jgi:predicted nucleotidyltransferase
MQESPVQSPAPNSEMRPIEPLLARIVTRLAPEEVWLFGSRAEGRARPDSDYDLLVVLPDTTPEANLDVVSVWMLVRGLDVPADIVPCTRSEFEEEKHEIDTLARAAFLRGRRIYERSACPCGRRADSGLGLGSEPTEHSSLTVLAAPPPSRRTPPSL